MKLKLTVVVCAALALGMLVTACAKPPTEEMNNAIEAVTRAENNIDAVTYAGNTIARAKDALARMQTEAAAKRYDAARSYAAEATAAAERAITEGRAGAARAREEAAALVAELPPLVAETRQEIAAAQTANLPLDFTVITTDFNTASYNADQAQEAYDGSRYQDSINLGRTARSGLADISQQISNAATARRK
ncbi:MAG: DUF4398 domain-containing protein [Treponema sp.]|nr:DUF4398 domain-containing protein [Treponema sp.]